MDDETALYVLDNRRYFEDFRQIAGQLAGLLVLAAAGSKSAPDRSVLEAARQLYGDAAEGIHRARVTARARRHHGHLLQASAALGSALSAALDNREIDQVLTPLKTAYAQLQQATDTLPGFEMISFEHACCAVHSEAPQ